MEEEISKCRVNVLPDQDYLGKITLKCVKDQLKLQTKTVTLTQDLLIFQ